MRAGKTISEQMLTLPAVQYTLQNTTSFVHDTLKSTSIWNNHNVIFSVEADEDLYDPELNKRLSNKPNFPQPTSASVLVLLSHVLQNQAFQNVS